MSLTRLFGRLDDPSPFLKQSPTTLLFLLALLITTIRPDDFVRQLPAVVVSIVLVGFATLIAYILTPLRSLRHLAILIPAIDFFAIGLLRFGTGVTDSAFAAIIILPMVWVASEAGRRYVAYAALGTAVAMLLPLVLDISLLFQSDLLVRAAVSTLVFAVAGFVINELARHSRLRLRAALDDAQRRKRMLEDSQKQTAELAESEIRLHEAQRMFRGLWDAVTEQAVIGTDTTGLIDAWNPGAVKMIGFSRDQTENKRYVNEFHLPQELEERSRDLNYPAGETVLNPGFSALVEPSRLGNADVREWTYLRADGSHVPVQLAVTPRLDEADNTVGYLFVANDMTQAKELSRLQDEFVGLISHELRTPLSSILGYLELLRDDEDAELSESQLHYLSVAERNANRLLRLVGDLLFTAQVDSGTFRIETQVQKLEAIVAQSIETAKPVAATAGVTINSELDEGVVVSGDAMRLGQACDNLISNAVKFTPQGGTITVRLSASDGAATVEVHDTGLGIAEADLEHLFSRFFRASTATKNAVPGVGLGLVITKAIVVAHGGTLDVASEMGVGTNFTMALPLA